MVKGAPPPDAEELWNIFYHFRMEKTLSPAWALLRN